MEDINKKIEDLNKKVNEINDTQKELKKQIEKFKGTKEELVLDFYKENTKDCKELLDLSKEANTYLGGDESLNEIWESFSKLYYKSFHGIIHGRVGTKIKIPDTVKEYCWQDNLWLNSRGLAFKPNDRYYYGWSENRDATKMIGSFWKIVKITKNNPEIEDYIPNDDKKEIFKAFYTCCKSWKELKNNKDNIKVNVIKLQNDGNYGTGIYDIYTKKYDTVEISYNSNKFTLYLTNEGSYSGTNIHLSEELDDGDLFLLSQMNDEILVSIKKFLSNLKKTYENNKKSYSKFREEVSPYILHRII